MQNAYNPKPSHTPVSAYEMRTPAQGFTHLPELFYMHHENRSAENVRVYITVQTRIRVVAYFLPVSQCPNGTRLVPVYQ